ncbi:TrbC/VirB2 family protein [Neorickettsia sennetsu]|uniref:Type IV secretion system protein VirB2 n=1 Tax=Ehrlichia sennetsu (strain ATCC VR-367 / Miyayama) TaxID=222891 RepID=Q2GD03_EHRS3|nr:TrbC/VirB2 family protein [Neorickettsia sennetsu]ABD46054.1 putative type IV secretion system protein VirB2 [Neorickettsia sennetsu str. Miyayama]
MVILKVFRMKRTFLWCFMLCCMFTLVSPVAAAEQTKDDSIVSRVICNIVTQLSGPISQAIATLVIIITGYSFFVGKVSIGMLFIVAAGIMFVFGAQTIMGWILGTDYKCTGGQVAGGGKST